MRSGWIATLAVGLALIGFSLVGLSRPIDLTRAAFGPQNLDLPANTGAQDGEDDDEGIAVVRIYGNDYESNSVVFCLDESNSMGNAGRWRIQKREVTQAIAELSSAVEFGIVFYGDDAYPFRRQLVKANASNKQAAIAFVTGRKTSPGTYLERGLRESLRIALLGRNPVVIVAGDGRPTNPRGRLTAPEITALIERSHYLNTQMKVRVHTIYVGSDSTNADIEFMKRLARAHRGRSTVMRH